MNTKIDFQGFERFSSVNGKVVICRLLAILVLCLTLWTGRLPAADIATSLWTIKDKKSDRYEIADFFVADALAQNESGSPIKVILERSEDGSHDRFLAEIGSIQENPQFVDKENGESKKPIQARVIYVDLKYNYVVFDKGMRDGVEIGDKVCLTLKNKKFWCSLIESSVSTVSAYHYDPKILPTMRKGLPANAFKRPQFEEKEEIAEELESMQPEPKEEEMIYSEREVDPAYNEYKDDIKDDTPFFTSRGTFENKMIETREDEVFVYRRKDISPSYSFGYMNTIESPFTYHSVYFASPDMRDLEDLSTHVITKNPTNTLWIDRRKVSNSDYGVFLRYTSAPIWYGNFSPMTYFKMYEWTVNQQPYLQDRLTYVETDQLAYSFGLACDYIFNVLETKRWSINPGIGLGIDESIVSFQAKAVGGVDKKFANYKSTLMLYGIRTNVAFVKHMDSMDFSLRLNFFKPLGASRKAKASVELPDMGDATKIRYSSDVNQDIEGIIDHRKNKYGVEFLLDLIYYI
ncbi:MAG: hypothetical protein HQK54_07465 [Oligoflexales bacterium]|nr:hypothetical protein [Oligoflexales bacterium]